MALVRLVVEQFRCLEAVELTLDLRYRDSVRHWLLICAEPWEYLIGWLTDELVKSYRATVGKSKSAERALKGIEKANQ